MGRTDQLLAFDLAQQELHKEGNMNYTKGEWYLELNQISGYNIKVNNKMVASVNHLEGRNPEGYANAHLIAASPMMYEALKRLYKIMAKDCGGCIHTELALGEAQEALAKAEGIDIIK